jgi:hypothetical protein
VTTGGTQADRGPGCDPDPERAGLDAELAGVEAHLGRVDAKAGLLLGLAGAGATAGLAVLPAARLPVPAAIVGYTAVALFVAAAGVLAAAVRPNLSAGRGRRPYGFARYATLTGSDVLADVLAAVAAGRSCAALADRLVALSALAASKYRRIRIAVDLMLTGLAVAVAASVLALAG